MRLRVVVTGGRKYTDRTFVYNTLDHVVHRYQRIVVIVGSGFGADGSARDWCADRGVRCIKIEAQWKKFGSAAGPLRNQKIIDEFTPGLVLAFPGGRGTNDMVRRAKYAGVKVEDYREAEDRGKGRSPDKTRR